MADNTQVDVDIDADTRDLDQGLASTAALLKQIETAAAGISDTFRNSGRSIGPLVAEISRLRSELIQANTEAEKLVLKQRLDQTNSAYLQAASSVRSARTEQQGIALDAQRQRNAMLDTATGDGRTVRQARTTNQALQDSITVLETKVENLVARMAEAIDRAARREATFSAPGYAQASVERARINAERTVARFGPGASEAAEAEKNARIVQTIKDNSLRQQQREEEAAQANLSKVKDRYFAQQQRQEETAQDAVRKIRDRYLRDQQKDEEAGQTFLSRVKDRYFRERQSEEEKNAKYLQGVRDRSMLQAQRAEEREQARAQRQADRTAKGELSAAESSAKYLEGVKARSMLAAQRAEENSLPNRVARSSEARNAMLDANGGADFFAFQSRLALNYQIFAAISDTIRNSVAAIVQFDDALGKFQAITGTTNSEMGKFRTGLLEIASTSRYTVTELAEVATILGQTGLSAQDVLKALPAVRDLATASGSTLSQSVEVITAALGAYNLQASRSGEIADILVGALNKTKLSMDQLQLGIQYSANVARDAGVSFSELTAVLGGIAQAGVKSGSTIGTGTRQLIQELLSPSEKLKTTLKELGISFAEIDIKANGLTGVLENLRSKGFTTADALRSLDLRAASAFASLAGQSERVKSLQQELLLSSSASDAAGKASESLTATLIRLTNTLFAVSDRAFKPFLEAMKVGAEGLTGLVNGFGALGPLLPAIGAGLTTIAASLAAIKLSGLLTGLLGGGGLAALATGPVGLLAGGAAALAFLVSLSSEADTAATKLDRLKATSNELTSRQSETETSVRSLSDEIDKLLSRRDRLNSDPIARETAIIESQRAFGALGLSIKGTSATVDELVESLRSLRAQLQGQLPNNLGLQIANLTEQLRMLREERERSAKASASTIVGDEFGTVIQGRNRFDRVLGSDFGDVFDLSNNTGALRTNASSVTSDARQRLNATQRDLLNRRDTLGVGAPELKGIDEKLGVLSDLIKILDDAVKKSNDIAATELTQRRLRTDQEAQLIGSRPEVQMFTDRAEDLRGEYLGRARTILNGAGPGGPGMKERNALVEMLRSQSQDASLFLEDAENLKRRLVEQGNPREAVDQAFSKIIDSFTALRRSVTKELDEVASSISEGATFALQAQRRANEAERKRLVKDLALARSPEEVKALEDALKASVAQFVAIENELINLKKTNPDDVAKSPELMAAKDAIAKQGQELEAGYMDSVKQRAIAVAKALLTFQVNSLDAAKARAEAEITELRKQIADPRTTLDKAKEMAESINRLLDQVKDIANRQATINEQKRLEDAPTGRIPSSAVGGSNPSFVNQDLSGAARIFLSAMASVESGGQYNIRYGGKDGPQTFTENGQHPRVAVTIPNGPNAGKTSDAAGFGQFLSSTWDKEFPGLPFTRENQEKAAWEYAKRRYQRATGRDLEQDINGGMTEEVIDALSPAWEGFSRFRNKAIAEFKAARGRGAGTVSAADVAGIQSAEERAKNDAKDRTARAEVDRDLVDKQRQIKLAELARVDKELASTLATDQSQLRRAVLPDQASTASSRVLDTIIKLSDAALQKEDQSKDGRTSEERAAGREAVAARYREQFQREAIANAETIGRKVAESYDKEIASLQAQIKTMSAPGNEDKFTQEQRLALQEQLRLAQERKAVDGESESIKRQLVELERAEVLLRQSGLGDGKSLLQIEERRAALRQRDANVQPQIKASRDADKRSESYEAAFSSAATNFGRSRGYVNQFGKLTSDVEVARKVMEDSLGSIANNLDKFWNDLFTGSKKGSDAIKDFAKSVLTDLARLASRQVTSEIFKLILGSTGTNGTAGGGLISSVMDFFTGKQLGGSIRMAGGGTVPYRDSVPILGEPGEFMMRKSAVDAIGRDKLQSMNDLGSTVLNDNRPAPIVMGGKGATATSNVYIMERDQQPTLGPNDVIQVIGSDIMRNGSIKQLIKQVQANG